jgi:hypothetical protein
MFKKNIMRKTQITLLILLMIPVLFFSCVKETNDKIDQIEKFYLNNPETIAQVKFIHAYTPLTVNGIAAGMTVGTTNSGTGFRITMDGNKINGATNTSAFTNTLIYGGIYPPTIAYAFLPPGGRNIKFVMNRITSGNFAPIAGDEVFNTTLALTAGKRYSMFIADPYGPPGVYTIEDNFEVPALNQYGLRFINLCADVRRFNITSARNGANARIFSNVAYKEMKDYIYLNTTGIDTIYLKDAIADTVVSSIPGFLPGTQKVYTLYARGKKGTANREPSLTFYTNR